MRTYAADATFWRAYGAHLPPELRLPDDDLPAEERFRWAGLEVHVDRYAAESGVPAVLFHGGGGYGRLLAPYGRLLRDAGASVALPDLPGYGLTACRREEMRYPLWVRCAAALVDAEHDRTGRPVLLVGASMGGTLALHAAMAARPGAVGAVVATTLLDPRSPAARRHAGRLALADAVLARLGFLDGLRVPVPLLAPVERMSASAPINRLCIRDPQGGGNRTPLGFFRSWLTYDPPIPYEAFDRCPVTLAHPGADRWTPPELSRATLERLAAPTTYVELERCGHLPLEQPGLDRLREVLAGAVAELSAAPA